MDNGSDPKEATSLDTLSGSSFDLYQLLQMMPNDAAMESIIMTENDVNALPEPSKLNKNRLHLNLEQMDSTATNVSSLQKPTRSSPDRSSPHGKRSPIALNGKRSPIALNGKRSPIALNGKRSPIALNGKKSPIALNGKVKVADRFDAYSPHSPKKEKSVKEFWAMEWKDAIDLRKDPIVREKPRPAHLQKNIFIGMHHKARVNGSGVDAKLPCQERYSGLSQKQCNMMKDVYRMYEA